MKNLIINNNDDFCNWNHNYPCKSGANILAFQNQAQDRSEGQNSHLPLYILIVHRCGISSSLTLKVISVMCNPHDWVCLLSVMYFRVFEKQTVSNMMLNLE